MGLLATCPRCKTTYVGGQACPSCNYREGEPEDGEADDLPGAYRSRKFWHRIAYTAYMIRGLSGGILGVVPLVWCWTGPIMAVVLIAVSIVMGTLSQLVLFSLRDYRELHCPACDTRLDELSLNHGRCPGCDVKLLS